MADPRESDPAQEQVRRLLADARHREPMPADVADRLDRVLAELRSGEMDEGPVAPVTDLAAVRRHRVRTWLVAAAAVVAIGVGLNQLSSPTGGGADNGASSAGSGSSMSRTRGTESGDRAGRAPSGTAPSAAAAVIRIHPGRFARQVARLQERRSVLSDTSAQRAELQGVLGARCVVPEPGRGRMLPVEYAQSPGVLLFRAPRGDTRVVDLYLCGDRRPTRSITLPVP